MILIQPRHPITPSHWYKGDSGVTIACSRGFARITEGVMKTTDDNRIAQQRKRAKEQIKR